MRLKLGEYTGASATAVSQYLRNRKRRVVVQYALGNASQRAERRHVAVAERLGGLRRVRLHEDAVAVWQRQNEEVYLTLHPSYDRPRLSEVALSVSLADGTEERTSPWSCGYYHVQLVLPYITLPQPLDTRFRGNDR